MEQELRQQVKLFEDLRRLEPTKGDLNNSNNNRYEQIFEFRYATMFLLVVMQAYRGLI